MMDGFRTSITDIRSLIKTVTLFFDKIGAGLLQAGQEVHLMLQSMIFLHTFVFLQ